MMRFEVLGEDLLYTRHGWVYHFNGGVKPHPRAWMEHTYKALYENWEQIYNWYTYHVFWNRYDRGTNTESN